MVTILLTLADAALKHPILLAMLILSVVTGWVYFSRSRKRVTDIHGHSRTNIIWIDK